MTPVTRTARSGRTRPRPRMVPRRRATKTTRAGGGRYQAAATDKMVQGEGEGLDDMVQGEGAGLDGRSKVRAARAPTQRARARGSTS